MIDMERFLENKVCIITGAAQGIGKSIAERFASDGALVYACDRAEGVMDEWAKACSEKYGTRVCPLYFDVTDAVAVKSAFMSVFKQERRIDVLVNNAGVLGASMPNATEEAFDKVIDTNLKGVFFLSQLFGGYLKANKVEGNILNVGSSSCLRPATSAYTLSKWGIRGLTLGLAKSLAPYGVTVNGIAPGPTATPMLLKDGQGNITNKGNPIGRYALPEEIANMAVVLVSPMGRTIVGDMVYMTGGAATVTYDDMDYTF